MTDAAHSGSPRSAGKEIDLLLYGGRTIKCLEWTGQKAGAPPIVLVADQGGPKDWNAFADQMSVDHRVLAVAPEESSSLLQVVWAVGEPAIVVTQGTTGREACRVASVAPGAVRALVLCDYAAPADATEHKSVAVPSLVVRGRQSEALNHDDAVALHEAIPDSHLVEPEHCGSWPAKDCADDFETAVRWFIQELGKPMMEFEVQGGDPKDPRE